MKGICLVSKLEGTFKADVITCSSEAMLTNLLMQTETIDCSSLNLPHFIHRIRQNYTTGQAQLIIAYRFKHFAANLRNLYKIK